MANILVVDDEPDIYQLVKRYAEHEGHQVTGAFDGATAISLCQQHLFDIVILDIMLPDLSGFTVCQEIRREKDIPVLMLSARGAEYDKLLGFQTGIDDYVVKPFSPKELMARIRVILSRHSSGAASGTEIVIGELRIDTLGHCVWIGQEQLALTAKEYELLLYFAENKGAALTRERILHAVWGYEACGDARTVDWQVKLLRNKLGDSRGRIVTLRGVGYRFEA